MSSPVLSETRISKTRQHLRRSFTLLSKCVPVLKETAEPVKPILKSMENLTDQYQCCSKVNIQDIPMQKDFPDVQGKLLFKITTEMEKEFSSLRKIVNILSEQSEKLSKQYDACMRHLRQQSSCRDLPDFVTRSDANPSIVDMLSWLRNAELSIRDQYLRKHYLLETFDIQDEKKSKQFYRSWSEGDKETIEVFENGLTKGALSTVDTCLPQLNTNGVTVERAVHITTKVMSILLTILDRRFVTFQSLVIFINKGKCGSDNRNDATLGYTSVKSSKRQEVHIYLKHHVSDIHVLGTLLHELGHCFVETFENGGHTDEWLQTTNKLMHLINYYIDDIPMLDSIRHDLCAVSIGPNYCDKFVEFKINV